MDGSQRDYFEARQTANTRIILTSNLFFLGKQGDDQKDYLFFRRK